MFVLFTNLKNKITYISYIISLYNMFYYLNTVVYYLNFAVFIHHGSIFCTAFHVHKQIKLAIVFKRQ